MTLEERIKLINAGYTKEEISAMEAPAKSEEKKEPEKAKPEEEKKESGPDFSALIAEAVAKAVAAAMVKPEPEKKEEKKEEKREPEKTQDDEVIKKLVSDQLKAFFQPSIKIDPVTDISDISKRFFEVSISKKEGE